MNQNQTDRVRQNTAKNVNQKIMQQIEESLKKALEDKNYIDHRIVQLNKEWDIERWLETNASVIAFIGVVLGYFVNIYWLILPAVVLLFLFQHAVQGWCPPIPILRRLNVRTQKEIDQELYSLKIIRLDFKDIDTRNTNTILSAIQK